MKPIFAAINRTPQGILKSREDRADKGKRVIFNLDDSDDDENPLERKSKSPKVFATAAKAPSRVIQVKPTVRASPKLVAFETEKTRDKVSGIPGKRVKRIENEECLGAIEEIEKFKMLFPAEQHQMNPKQIKDKQGSKKTPFKSKIKKVIPRAKKTNAKEKMDLSWFDSDSAFGFGTEE